MAFDSWDHRHGALPVLSFSRGADYDSLRTVLLKLHGFKVAVFLDDTVNDDGPETRLLEHDATGPNGVIIGTIHGCWDDRYADDMVLELLLVEQTWVGNPPPSAFVVVPFPLIKEVRYL